MAKKPKIVRVSGPSSFGVKGKKVEIRHSKRDMHVRMGRGDGVHTRFRENLRVPNIVTEAFSRNFGFVNLGQPPGKLIRYSCLVLLEVQVVVLQVLVNSARSW